MALPKLLDDVSNVNKKKPSKLPYGLPVEDWMLIGPNDFAKMRKLKPKTKDDILKRAEPDWFYKHYFTDNDSWQSLAEKAGYPDPQLLVRLNFGIGIDVIGRPNGEQMNFPEINWLMETYCNCNRTRDGKNYSFSSSAHGNTEKGRGFIWMPKRPATPWPPPIKIDPGMDPEPVEVDPAIVSRLPKMASQFPTGRPNEYGYLGKTYHAVTDARLVLHIGNSLYPTIHYMVVSVKEPGNWHRVGKVYRQSYWGFQQDTWYAAEAEVGRRGRAFQRLAWLEVKFMMGVAEGAQGLIGGIIVFGGMGAVEFILDNSHKFDKWAKIAGAVDDLTDAMKKHTPKFYYKVRNALFWKIVRETPGQLWNDPDMCARVAGNWLGGFGRLAFLSTLTRLNKMLAALGPVAAKGAFKMPAAGEKVGMEYVDAAKTIGKAVMDMGGTLSDTEELTGLEIISEVSLNYIHIKGPLDKLTALLVEGY